MNQTKFQHYVPRFYLARFADENGFIWVLDKFTGSKFKIAPENIAAENNFYDVPDLKNIGSDPRHIESQFSDLESEVSKITASWFQQFENAKALEIPKVNREIVSLFIVLQLLRTAEARTQITQFSRLAQPDKPIHDVNNLHAQLLWNDKLINRMAKKVGDCNWIFAHNLTEAQFFTSDHPVLVKSAENKEWLLSPRIFDDGMSIVFPLSPTWILYCDSAHQDKLAKFNNSISPVTFTQHMANHENSGQVGMSRRFVFSQKPDFEFAKMFCDLHPEIKNPERERFEWAS
jgi:hypothetical protein